MNSIGESDTIQSPYLDVCARNTSLLFISIYGENPHFLQANESNLFKPKNVNPRYAIIKKKLVLIIRMSFEGNRAKTIAINIDFL